MTGIGICLAGLGYAFLAWRLRNEHKRGNMLESSLTHFARAHAADTRKTRLLVEDTRRDMEEGFRLYDSKFALVEAEFEKVEHCREEACR